jgi:hypothetical protein
VLAVAVMVLAVLVLVIQAAEEAEHFKAVVEVLVDLAWLLFLYLQHSIQALEQEARQLLQVAQILY